MVKNEKGVTLMLLVITIIILMILMGVSFNTGYSSLTNVKAGKAIANMNLIKTKVDDIYYEYQFNADESVLIGVNNTKYSLSDIVSQNNISSLTNEFVDYNSISSLKNWYEWDKNILKSQGLDTQFLNSGGKIFVNYENGEVIYTKGATINNNQYYYTLTAIEKAFETE